MRAGRARVLCLRSGHRRLHRDRARRRRLHRAGTPRGAGTRRSHTRLWRAPRHQRLCETSRAPVMFNHYAAIPIKSNTNKIIHLTQLKIALTDAYINIILLSSLGTYLLCTS